MDESKTEPEPKPKPTTTVKTATELYLLNKSELLSTTNEYDHYHRMMKSINIGSSMLKFIGHEDLKDSVNSALSNESNYPEKRNMNWLDSRKVYSCSSGIGEAGKIMVRPEELANGDNSIMNQQCSAIIRRIEPLEREIFDALLADKIIKTQNINERIESEMGL